jgi:hypothetical protein
MRVETILDQSISECLVVFAIECRCFLMPSQLTPTPSAPPQREEAPSIDLHVLPRDLETLFAERPLIRGERAEDYDELLARVTGAVGPTDVIEAVWVRDIVDLIWEVQRRRRLKVSLLMLATSGAPCPSATRPPGDSMQPARRLAG